MTDNNESQNFFWIMPQIIFLKQCHNLDVDIYSSYCISGRSYLSSHTISIAIGLSPFNTFNKAMCYEDLVTNAKMITNHNFAIMNYLNK